MRTEKQLQAFVMSLCKCYNVICYKIRSPGHRGVPDLLLLCGEQAWLLELKSPAQTGRLSALQRREIRRLRDAGVRVDVCDTEQHAERVIAALAAGADPG